MKPFARLIISAGFLLVLNGCAGDVKVEPRVFPKDTETFKPTSAFERADQDRNGQLNYREYKNFADIKASQDELEKFLRDVETSSGNSALHKRFIALDRDNNWQLSPMELGGG